MTVWQFRPLLKWDGPETDPRTHARFRASWDDTTDLLKRECELLGAQAIAIQVDASEADIRRDGMLYARAKVGHPGVKVAFASDYGPLTYATDEFTYWQDNVRAIALTLTNLRAVDRYGVSKRGEQYTGWAALGTKPAAHDDLTVQDATLIFADALKGIAPETLNLVTERQISYAYRMAAKRHHPDVKPGNDAVWLLITRARDVLLRAAK